VKISRLKAAVAFLINKIIQNSQDINNYTGAQLYNTLKLLIWRKILGLFLHLRKQIYQKIHIASK